MRSLTPSPQLSADSAKRDDSTSLRPCRTRGALLRAQRRERLAAQDVEAGDDADRRDEHRVSDDADERYRRAARPGDVERVAADAPARGRAPPTAPTLPASSPSKPYSTSSTRADEARARAERLQDRRLVDAAELVIATAPTRISTPLNSTRPPTTVIAERDVATMTLAIVSSTSRTSITETFGNARDQSRCSRARAARSSGPRAAR